MPDQMSQFQQREEVLVESTSGSDKVLCFNIFAKRCGKVVQICSSKQVKLGLLDPVIDNWITIIVNKTTKLKLTSVKIIKDLYNDFRHASIDDDINLQKLVNRCMMLYITDEEFRDKVSEEAKLTESGSSF